MGLCEDANGKLLGKLIFLVERIHGVFRKIADNGYQVARRQGDIIA